MRSIFFLVCGYDFFIEVLVCVWVDWFFVVIIDKMIELYWFFVFFVLGFGNCVFVWEVYYFIEDFGIFVVLGEVIDCVLLIVEG